MNEIKGKVKLVLEKEVFSSGFEKQSVVVTTDEKYPQDIKIDFAKEKAALLNKITRGDEVLVNYNIRGNEYNGKYFTNIDGWKIQKITNQNKSSGSTPSPSPSDDIEEDCPF